ncbi:MAG: YopX family protein [Owenweeksia sp.]
MVDFSESRYRLRKGKKIVGYMRKISDNMILYSRDSFWWNGSKMNYEEIDEWTGLRDKNGRTVYEWDIVYYKLDPDAADREGVILWEENRQTFGIRDIHSELFIPLALDGLAMFNERQLKVFSYLFLNPELKERLGIKD